jgi:hypothetical protein
LDYRAITRNAAFKLKSSTETASAYVVQGDEGLLDTNRMEKAFKGSGVKIPLDKKLKFVVLFYSIMHILI